MGIRAVLASLVLHAGVAVLLGRLEPRDATRVEAAGAAPIEIAMVPVKAKAATATATETAAATETETETPTATAKEGGRRRGRPARGRAAAAPAAGGSTGNPEALRMRSGSGGESEVVIPMPWQIGKVEGAPRADALPPGAMGGPVQGPMPYVPRGDPLARALGHGVEADGDGGYREDRAGYRARIDRDGTVHFKDKSWVRFREVSPLGMLSLVFTMDLTDGLLRALGDDPYAYEKMKLMEETREVRAGMAMRDRSERFREAQKQLGNYLERIWGFGRFTLAQKRRILFALWEEAAEEGDPELLRNGAMARATIEAFIRRRLPEGAPHGYTDDELAGLNRARKSRKRFEPYAR